MRFKLFVLSFFLIVSLVMPLYVREAKASPDTFGNLNIEATEKNIDGGIRGTAFTCPEDGTANFIMVYLTGWDAGTDVQCCLYKKSDGTIVKATETRNSGGSDGWHQFDFADPKPSVENIDYGLLCLAEFNDPHLDTAMRSGAFSVYRYYKYIGSNPMTFPDPFDGTEGTANFRYSIYCDYTPSGEEYIVDLTQAVSTVSSVLAEWDATTDFTQSLTTSWSILTEWNAMLDVTQSLTTSWSVLANLNSFVDLSQALSTTWNVLIGWDAILDFTQSLTTSWTVLTKTSFNVITSLSNTFTWLVDSVHTIGVNQYVIDLTQPLTTTWTILTQWNSLIDLSQSLTTTWTVLIQSSFNLITSITNTFTWLVEVATGVSVSHIADLTLTLVTSWLISIAYTPWTEIYATKGFVLATIMLLLLIGIPIFALVWSRKE